MVVEPIGAGAECPDLADETEGKIRLNLFCRCCIVHKADTSVGCEGRSIVAYSRQIKF